MNRANEVSVRSEFERFGGKVFSPIYYPPEVAEIYPISQKKDDKGGILTPLWRLYKGAVHLLYGSSPVVPERTEASISCISWKDDKMFCAAAFPDSSIRFYDLEKQQWRGEVLKHHKMIGIQSISWKPSSPHTLVVGCINGVFLWKIIKQNQGTHCRRLPGGFDE